MTGTILNVIAILLGGILGALKFPALSVRHQNLFKVGLGLATMACGLALTWRSVNGSLGHVLKQLAIILLALILGKLLGRLLRLQKGSNRLGRAARERIAAASPQNSNRFSDGFVVCATLFCAAPLGILGAIHDGLSGYFYPLAIKAVMDGLAAMSFVAMFGPGVLLSAAPVLVFQGTIALASARFLQPFLEAHGLLDSVNATGGLVIFSVALLIFEVKKVEVAAYLPSLVVAPLLTWLWR